MDLAMGMGMPWGFQELLNRKYAIMQQQADTARVGVDAAAGLDRARTAVLPLESEANVAESRARTTNLGLTGQTIIPLANANLGLITAQTYATGAEGDNTRERTTGLRQLNRRRPGTAFGLSPAFGALPRFGM